MITISEKMKDHRTNIVFAEGDDRMLLQDAMATLESIMAEGLNFSTEQSADSIVSRIKRYFINQTFIGFDTRKSGR